MPTGVVTLTLPDAPEPITAFTVVGETTENEAAAIPPNETAVVPVKLVPVIIIVESAAALVGLNEVMVGADGGMI